MSSATPAQEEFASFLARNDKERNGPRDRHPEDQSDDDEKYSDDLDLDEEDRYRNTQIDAAMRTHNPDRDADTALKLPPASFDSGRATGVKGVIADARHYEMTKKKNWKTRARAVRNSVSGFHSVPRDRSVSSSGDSDQESFIKQWRESRRRELESENRSNLNNRRTSPSARAYGELDEVDAMGYLDAIEKVGRETTVVVFIYDDESMVSSAIESALRPLVRQNLTVHFVKVHYEDVDFDNVGVPAILAYRNQGDLFANLTGLIEMMPDEEHFDSNSLETILQQHSVL